MSSSSLSGARLSARTLTTLPELLRSLSELQSLESALSESLGALLASHEPIDAAVLRLNALSSHIDELHLDASLLSNKVQLTAKTAERVGGRVRTLDEEMRRVKEAGERVGLVMELKSSLASLHDAMESQDWESATRHCARAMSMPPEVLSGPFAETAVPSAEFPLPPAQALEEARQHLLKVFLAQFEKASTSRDSVATSRFFKLFPVIGWEEQGLQAYADFVVDLVRGRAPVTGKTSSPLYYITTLTSLFESIALIVDQHQPIVEKYYGAGKMLNVVRRLLEECDRVVKGLLDGWKEERGMERKLQDASNPTFYTLTTSSLPRKPGGFEEETLDPRDVEKVLSEMAGMAGRWGLFRRFLWERLRDDQSSDSSATPDRIDSPRPGTNPTPKPSATDQPPEPDSKPEPEPESPEKQLLESCACREIIENLLSTYYIPLETWYLRTIIDKAHRLSVPDASAQPAPQTTTPDDVFYILKLVLARLVSAGSLGALEKTCAATREIMERDYAGVIARKMEDVYAGKSQMSGPRAEKVERENRAAFTILLNDLDLSSSHMETLVSSITASSHLSQNFLEIEVEPARACLSSLLTLVPKFKSIIKLGIEQIFNQLIRPRMRSLMAEVYKDITYVIDDEQYQSAEYHDLVRKRFVKAWNLLMDGFKEALTEANFRAFFALAIDVLVRPWEKHVMGMRFTELGGIRFDKDLRAMTAFLSSQTTFGDIREKFQRLQQISTLLNLDEEEDPEEFYNGSGIAWRLSAAEVRAVINLRV
ncbi:hypothetical protein BOTBODRAFT_176521 [Botryobasidium botryosum FD-172 SS1]|uniref:Conserved oligomeric Golgi complex subunit 4 n=1 Tax=Botryobasidium botryosum (strain FD-172 SS1) TaxID=930990 RepID=A0A067M9M9_BOTB1|nr:hypothetical protein BOTBODRAFT_176521 [Botryobasidium botryosum FD-172 SS1]